MIRLTVLSLLIFAAGAQAEAKLKVVTTLPSFADIAQNVGGEEVEVVSLTRGNQDPHFVDPRPDLVLMLNRAELLIRVGLGMEDGWLPPLLTGSRNAAIQAGSPGYLDASTVVELKEIPAQVDRSMGDVHPGGNPHYMLDPRNGMKFAKALAERLGKLVPEKAAKFTERAEAYVKDLTSKTTAWEAALKHLSAKPVVTYHKSWIYLSAWLKLTEVGYVEPKPGIPPSPEHVVRLIAMMKEKKVPLLIVEPYYPKSTAEHIAKEAGARFVTLPTEVKGVEEAKSYAGIFDAIAQKLKDVK